MRHELGYSSNTVIRRLPKIDLIKRITLSKGGVLVETFRYSTGDRLTVRSFLEGCESYRRLVRKHNLVETGTTYNPYN